MPYPRQSTPCPGPTTPPFTPPRDLSPSWVTPTPAQLSAQADAPRLEYYTFREPTAQELSIARSAAHDSRRWAELNSAWDTNSNDGSAFEPASRPRTEEEEAYARKFWAAMDSLETADISPAEYIYRREMIYSGSFEFDPVEAYSQAAASELAQAFYPSPVGTPGQAGSSSHQFPTYDPIPENGSSPVARGPPKTPRKGRASMARTPSGRFAPSSVGPERRERKPSASSRSARTADAAISPIRPRRPSANYSRDYRALLR